MFKLISKSEYWTTEEITNYVDSVYGIQVDKSFKLKRDAVKIASKIYARMGIKMDIVPVVKTKRLKGRKHPCPKHACYNSLMVA